MRFFGLIGKSIEHSFSPQYFKKKFEKEGIEFTFYQLYSLETIDEFNHLIGDFTEFSGLNVTIPYKTSVIPFLDDLDQAAKKIGAVNTIKFEWHNTKLKLKGYNTDYLGFMDSIKPNLSKEHSKALVLGTGGSSLAITYALNLLGIQYQLVSRKEQNNCITYNDLNSELINEYNLIINTTPVGMYPNTENYPLIPYEYLTPKHFLFDLIYNPAKTQFLKFGKKAGAKIQNGLKMLELQAEHSWKIWNDL